MYYVDVPQGLTGGHLKFRVAGEPPDPSYTEYCEVDSNITVPTKHNTCVVFANSIPHRVRLMQNQSDRTITRTFINFFFVDPKDTQAIPLQHFTGVELCDRLTTWVREQLNKTLPLDVLKIITGHLGLWSGLDEAKTFRGEYRRAMMSTTSGERGGWAYMHYGNCGVQKFAPYLNALSERWLEETNTLHHTDSNSPSDGCLTAGGENLDDEQ